MGEGGTPVAVTGSLSHGSQPLVNTTPPSSAVCCWAFLGVTQVPIDSGSYKGGICRNLTHNSSVFSLLFHSVVIFCQACMSSLEKTDQLSVMNAYKCIYIKCRNQRISLWLPVKFPLNSFLKFYLHCCTTGVLFFQVSCDLQRGVTYTSTLCWHWRGWAGGRLCAVACDSRCRNWDYDDESVGVQVHRKQGRWPWPWWRPPRGAGHLSWSVRRWPSIIV